MDVTPNSNADRRTVMKLVRETGVTEAQAVELVMLLGTDWSSVVREAKALLKKT